MMRALLLLFFAASGARAATTPAADKPAPPVLIPSQVPAVATPPNADTSAGHAIASRGANGAAACASCHGANGQGNSASGFPRLAGLGRLYFLHQLDSFADGTRRNAVMTPIAGALSTQQRAAVAAYYSRLGNAGAAAARPRGEAPVLALRGDDKRGLQACVNCHGVQGIGDMGANPYLAGQVEQYLANAIGEWKGGSRRNDPSGQMPAIAKALTEAEAKQLAAYFAALPPPAPRKAQSAAVAPGNGSRAMQSGPADATAPPHGSATGRGAPLTGGGQGPGAGDAATNPGRSTR